MSRARTLRSLLLCLSLLAAAQSGCEQPPATPPATGTPKSPPASTTNESPTGTKPPSAPTSPTTPSAPTSSSGTSIPKATSFESWARAFIADPKDDAMLPNPEAWFAEYFAAADAARLAAEYKAQIAANGGVDGGGGLAAVVRRTIAAGNSEMKAITVTGPDDRNGTGLQRTAIKAATKPLTLHTIRLTKPGEDLGTTFWSFAETDGTYRFVGKMRALNAPAN